MSEVIGSNEGVLYTVTGEHALRNLIEKEGGFEGIIIDSVFALYYGLVPIVEKIRSEIKNPPPIIYDYYGASKKSENPAHAVELWSGIGLDAVIFFPYSSEILDIWVPTLISKEIIPIVGLEIIFDRYHTSLGTYMPADTVNYILTGAVIAGVVDFVVEGKEGAVEYAQRFFDDVKAPYSLYVRGNGTDPSEEFRAGKYKRIEGERLSKSSRLVSNQ